MKRDFLNLASKDLMSEFVYSSVGRVLKKELWGSKPVPQCVSIYVYHAPTDKFEYMFTKDDRIDFKRDLPEEVEEALRAYSACNDSEIILYMHRAGIEIVSKHRQYPF